MVSTKNLPHYSNEHLEIRTSTFCKKVFQEFGRNFSHTLKLTNFTPRALQYLRNIFGAKIQIFSAFSEVNYELLIFIVFFPFGVWCLFCNFLWFANCQKPKDLPSFIFIVVNSWSGFFAAQTLANALIAKS